MKFNASAVKDIDQDLIEQEGSTYPTIFLRNGNVAMKKVGGVAYLGGWFITEESAPTDMTAHGWVKDSFTSESNGEEITGYYAPSITVAVLAERKRWMANGQSFTWNQFDQAKEAGSPRGSMQFLVVLKGAESLGLFMIGLKGHAGMAFRGSRNYSATGCLSCFSRTVIAAANAMTKPQKWPYWAFWMTAAAANDGKGAPLFVEVGTTAKSRIVLPVPVGLPDKAEKVSLDDFYIGDDLLEQHKALRSEVQPWVDAWDSFAGTSASNGNGKHDDGESDEEVTAATAESLGL
jgi:hypothetical protein